MCCIKLTIWKQVMDPDKSAIRFTTFGNTNDSCISAYDNPWMELFTRSEFATTLLFTQYELWRHYWLLSCDKFGRIVTLLELKTYGGWICLSRRAILLCLFARRCFGPWLISPRPCRVRWGTVLSVSCALSYCAKQLLMWLEGILCNVGSFRPPSGLHREGSDRSRIALGSLNAHW
jgi:hypothetical protein